MNTIELSDFDLSRLYDLLQDDEISKKFEYEGEQIKKEVTKALNS